MMSPLSSKTENAHESSTEGLDLESREKEQGERNRDGDLESPPLNIPQQENTNNNHTHNQLESPFPNILHQECADNRTNKELESPFPNTAPAEKSPDAGAIPAGFPNVGRDSFDDNDNDQVVSSIPSDIGLAKVASVDDNSVVSDRTSGSRRSRVSSLFSGRRPSLKRNGSRKRKSMIEYYKEQASRPLNKRGLTERMFAVGAGILLSFNSGFINGCCLSGLLLESGSVKQGVSAFTGGYTKAGLALADGDTSFFGFEVAMISSFICGSCISALINPRPKPFQLGPTYGPTFLIGSVLLAISSTLSSTHPDWKALFYFAAAANGLQNGMSSMYSANLIRTSHLTGTSTDIGLFIGQFIRGNRANTFKLGVLCSLALSFWSGAFTSLFAVRRYGGFALIFNAVLFFLIGVGCLIFVILTNKLTIWQAVTGKWHWNRALDALSLREQCDGSDECYLAIFDKLDVDGDGALEAEELYLALKAAGMRVTHKGAEALIAIGDYDGDGKISREEWLQLMQRNAITASPEMEGNVVINPV